MGILTIASNAVNLHYKGTTVNSILRFSGLSKQSGFAVFTDIRGLPQFTDVLQVNKPDSKVEHSAKNNSSGGG
jgi:hypothetical protein